MKTADAWQPARLTRIGGLKPLPDETIITSLQSAGQRLFLTNQRLIFYGDSKRLFILTGGRVLASAMLQDVDAVTAGNKFLPTWLAILGALITLYGLTIIGGRDGGIGFVALAIGLGLIVFWYFFGTSVLEFKVSAMCTSL